MTRAIKNLEEEILALRSNVETMETIIRQDQVTVDNYRSRIREAETQLAQQRIAEAEAVDVEKDDELEVVGFTVSVDNTRMTAPNETSLQNWLGKTPNPVIEPVVRKSEADAKIKELSDLVMSLSETQEQPVTFARVIEFLEKHPAMYDDKPIPLLSYEGLDAKETSAAKVINKIKSNFNSEMLYEVPSSIDVISTPAELDEDTVNLVLGFATALAFKLRKSEAKYKYTNEWKQPGWPLACKTMLMKHIEKGDPLDVAAYCAFMWYHGWSTK